jgi:hypothetical protein
MATHFGVHAEAAQARPGPQLLSQPPQFLASFVGLTHFRLQAICGAWQTRFRHWPPVQTLPPVQSASPQHSKQPVPAQHLVPATLAQLLPDEQEPLLHTSAVQELPSLHWLASQHWAQVAPQSLGVVGAQAQLPAVQVAPVLQALVQPPQLASSFSVFTSQPRAASQSAKPAVQVGLPATQVWLTPTGMPQPPQFSGSVFVSTQDEPQAVKAPQPAMQVVPSQTGKLAGHATVHEPQ